MRSELSLKSWPSMLLPLLFVRAYACIVAF